MTRGEAGSPFLGVDLRRLTVNIGRWQRAADAAGAATRPHVKGHRSAEIARRQVGAGAVGIAAYFAREAHRYVDAGISDVVIAYPWRDPWRWPRLAELARRAGVSVHVDDATAVDGLGAAAVAAGVTLGARIAVHNGLIGVAPTDVGELAKRIATTPGLRLDGVTSYVALNTAQEAADRFDGGRRQAQLLVRLAAQLRADGLDCPVVALGGTPTAAGALSVPGVTEVCSGAHALYDGGLADLGVCSPDDVAVTITARRTGTGTDADALLAGSAQPWCPPEQVATTIAENGATVTLRPAHVCPVVRQVDHLRVHSGGTDDARWPVIFAPDRETVP